MSRVRGRVFQAAMAASFLGIFTTSAYAYLDPGTGSMILQVLLGGVAGIALAGKLYWQKIRSFIGLARNEEAEVPEGQQTDPRTDAHGRG
jgi:hypothetical protein